MIFITTGTQAPFNRLIRAMDEIAGALHAEQVIAQATGADFEIKHMKLYEFLGPHEFQQIFDEAKLIISHAGMGTIISALVASKPIIIVPRIASLGEHRNEHQMATAKKMDELGYMPVVYNIADLRETVVNLINVANHATRPKISALASESLVNSLQEFFADNRKRNKGNND